MIRKVLILLTVLTLCLSGLSACAEIQVQRNPPEKTEDELASGAGKHTGICRNDGQESRKIKLHSRAASAALFSFSRRTRISSTISSRSSRV